MRARTETRLGARPCLTAKLERPLCPRPLRPSLICGPQIFQPQHNLARQCLYEQTNVGRRSQRLVREALCLVRFSHSSGCLRKPFLVGDTGPGTARVTLLWSKHAIGVRQGQLGVTRDRRNAGLGREGLSSCPQPNSDGLLRPGLTGCSATQASRRDPAPEVHRPDHGACALPPSTRIADPKVAR